jgi:dolichol-phosphate mannosyltransferase
MSPAGLVVVPTYDEAENIEMVLGRIRAAVPDLDILVVDDASPDGTGILADQAAADDAHINVLHGPRKRGLGSAYLAGFAWAFERGYDVIVEMDADGSHLPEQLPALLEALQDADLALGARWVSGGRVVNWPLRRRLLSRCGNAYVRLVLGLPLEDATGGFRAFRRETLEGLDLASVNSQGYCFQVDLARRAVRAGYRVVEVPITFVERTHGRSKMSRAIVREALLRVSVWGLHHRVKQLRSLAGAQPAGRH